MKRFTTLKEFMKLGWVFVFCFFPLGSFRYLYLFYLTTARSHTVILGKSTIHSLRYVSFPPYEMFPLRNITRSQLVKTLNPDCLDWGQNLQLELGGIRILKKKGKKNLLNNI